MVDIVSIVVSVVVVVVLIAVSFYLYIMYCHPDDKGIGVAIPSKILLVVAQALAWGQLLLLPLDVSNSAAIPFQAMEIIYSVIYWFMLFLSIYIIPFTIETDSWLSRICWSLLFSTIISTLFIAVIFVSYIWLGVYTINGISYSVIPGLYVMICLSLPGYVLLAINGGIGLVWVPHDLIQYFVNRPKPISTEDAYKKKQTLQLKSDRLVETGEILKQKGADFYKKLADKGWFQKRKEESDLKSSLQIFKNEVTQLEQEHEIFDKQLKITKTHPLVYWVSLFFGILAGIISLLWLVQLVGTVIYSGGMPIFLFIDSLLYDISKGSVSFLATAIYALLVLYLLGCVVKGNIIFGIRIPYIISFHAMKLNKTLMNSFLFNVNLMMLSSLAITQMSVITFGTYLQQSYLYTFFIGQVYRLPMFGWIYQNRIFPAALVIVILMAIVAATVKGILACRKKNNSEPQGQQNGVHKQDNTNRQMQPINE